MKIIHNICTACTESRWKDFQFQMSHLSDILSLIGKNIHQELKVRRLHFTISCVILSHQDNGHHIPHSQNCSDQNDETDVDHSHQDDDSRVCLK